MAVTAIRGVPGAEFDMSSMMKRRKDTAESDSIRKKLEQGLRLQAQEVAQLEGAGPDGVVPPAAVGHA